jgi:hypothetical protein
MTQFFFFFFMFVFVALSPSCWAEAILWDHRPTHQQKRVHFLIRGKRFQLSIYRFYEEFSHISHSYHFGRLESTRKPNVAVLPF